MKFTKEQLSETLKTRLSNNGKKELSMSERTYNGMIDRLFKRLEKSSNADEIELPNVIEDYLDDFVEADNNIRNDNSQFVIKWQKEHPEFDPKKKKKDEPEKAPDDRIEKLLLEIEGLKKEREEEKAAKLISDKRTALKTALKGKNVKNEDWINSQLELIAVNTDTDVDALADKLVQNYNKYNASFPKCGTPKSAGGGEFKEDFSDVANIVKKNALRF